MSRVRVATSLNIMIGCKLTNFLSLKLNVSTARDGKNEIVHFEDGLFVSREMKNISKDQHGTSVQYIPDPQFFTHDTVEIEKVKTLFKTITCLCPGLIIKLNDNGTNYEFKSENGLNDLVDDAVGNKEIIDNRMDMTMQEGKNKMRCILTYTSNYSATIVPYINTGLTESGPHITQIKTTITREFNKFFKEKKWLKEKDDSLSGDDIQEGMYVVFNITAPNVSYDAQVKSRVTKINMSPFTSAFAENLQYWLGNNEKEIKAIFDKATLAKKAREAAKKARDAVKNVNKEKKGKKKLLDLPTKLVDCWGKDRSKCELYILEGDSAANGLVNGRDAETQALFPIRGKILAVYKAKLEKILANQEIVNIIKALGLAMNKDGKLEYDKSKLRYHKIYLGCDGDSDGGQIRNLLLELFWWLCPELVINGHIWTTVPPLFRVIEKSGKIVYLRDQNALEEYYQKIGKRVQANRLKGIGECDPIELEEILLDPKTRNVFQVTVDNIDIADNLLEILMGPRVEPRREYLLAHAEEAHGEWD